MQRRPSCQSQVLRATHTGAGSTQEPLRGHQHPGHPGTASVVSRGERATRPERRGRLQPGQGTPGHHLEGGRRRPPPSHHHSRQGFACVKSTQSCLSFVGKDRLSCSPGALWTPPTLPGSTLNQQLLRKSPGSPGSPARAPPTLPLHSLPSVNVSYLNSFSYLAKLILRGTA